jgi:hypothetical protein
MTSIRFVLFTHAAVCGACLWLLLPPTLQGGSPRPLRSYLTRRRGGAKRNKGFVEEVATVDAALGPRQTRARWSCRQCCSQRPSPRRLRLRRRRRRRRRRTVLILRASPTSSSERSPGSFRCETPPICRSPVGRYVPCPPSACCRVDGSARLRAARIGFNWIDRGRLRNAIPPVDRDGP